MSSTISNPFALQIELNGATALFLHYVLIAFVLYLITSSICNLYLHPLSRYPGPPLYAISKLPINYRHIDGSSIKWLRKVHTIYGLVVRIGPNELSFIDAAAWQDIYGFKNPSLGGQMPKDPAFYRLDPSEMEVNMDADIDDASHGRQRKIFSHAFSERALREQEGLIGGYVDKLIAKLAEKVERGEGAEMCRLLNFTTFDIMSDLAFGYPLGLLASDSYHPWVGAIFDNLHAIAITHAILQFTTIKLLINNLLGPFLKRQREKHFGFTREKVNARLARKTERPDIWSLVIRANDGEKAGLTEKEMYANAGLFMIAGTETTATLLSGLMYLLLTHPDAMHKLQREVRALSEDRLNLLELPKLEYLHACIEEGLRMYPPVPVGLPRKTPPQGATIAGHFVPGNTTVSIPHAVAYASPTNFTDPSSFAPERWLSPSSEGYNETYEKDVKKVFNPFSAGPRNCLGKNLAYHEMRLILAKLIWHFEFELCDQDMGRGRKWMDQRVLLFWEKKPLVVRVRAVER